MKYRVEGVHHVAVSVPDIELARKFYVDLLGAKITSEIGWENNAFIDAIVGLPGSAAKSFMATLGNTHIEVFEYTAPQADPQDANRGVNQYGYTHFGIQVDDIMEVYERMKEAGIRFHAPPEMSAITVDADGTKHGYTATYGRDFFGNVFEIMEIYDHDQINRV